MEGCEPFRVILMVDCGSVLVCPWPSVGMTNAAAAVPVNLMKSRLAIVGWDDGFMVRERVSFQGRALSGSSAFRLLHSPGAMPSHAWKARKNEFAFS